MLNFHVFKIHRLAAPDDESGDGYRREYADTGLILTGSLDTASPEFAAVVDGEFGKTFQLFCDDAGADVVVGDRLEDERDGAIYDVKGVLPQMDGPGRGLQITLTFSISQ